MSELYAFRRPSPMPFRVAGMARHGFPGLSPAPYPRAAAAIDVPRLALEIGSSRVITPLPMTSAKGTSVIKSQRLLKGNGQADETQHHAEVDGLRVKR